MARDKAPNSLRRGQPITTKNNMPSNETHTSLEEVWRQVVAGFVIVPCVADGTDLIVLTPRLHQEGGATYGDGMTWCAAAAETSGAAVTACVASLPVLKVYKDAGAAQAGAGDVVQGGVYLFVYNSALDGGSGGLVLK